MGRRLGHALKVGANTSELGRTGWQAISGTRRLSLDKTPGARASLLKSPEVRLPFNQNHQGCRNSSAGDCQPLLI